MPNPRLRERQMTLPFVEDRELARATEQATVRRRIGMIASVLPGRPRGVTVSSRTAAPDGGAPASPAVGKQQR